MTSCTVDPKGVTTKNTDKVFVAIITLHEGQYDLAVFRRHKDAVMWLHDGLDASFARKYQDTDYEDREAGYLGAAKALQTDPTEEHLRILMQGYGVPESWDFEVLEQPLR